MRFERKIWKSYILSSLENRRRDRLQQRNCCELLAWNSSMWSFVLRIWIHIEIYLKFLMKLFTWQIPDNKNQHFCYMIVLNYLFTNLLYSWTDNRDDYSKPFSWFCFLKQSPTGKKSQQRSWYRFQTYDSWPVYSVLSLLIRCMMKNLQVNFTLWKN